MAFLLAVSSGSSSDEVSDEDDGRGFEAAAAPTAGVFSKGRTLLEKGQCRRFEEDEEGADEKFGTAVSSLTEAPADGACGAGVDASGGNTRAGRKRNKTVDELDDDDVLAAAERLAAEERLALEKASKKLWCS